MNDYWDSLSARINGLYTPADFESAAYRIIAEQTLYHADQRSRVAYGLIEQYEREFSKALAPFGVSLQVNRQLRYATALPRHARAAVASVPQTLFALVLRGIYEESARIGDLTEDGEVLCDVIELTEKYRLMTGRELPGKGEFDGLMRVARRWGIARKLDDSDVSAGQSGSDAAGGGIAIRPGIVEALGEAALQRLEAWHLASSSGDAVSVAVNAEEGEGGSDEEA